MKRRISGSATGAVALFVASSMIASVLGLRQYERSTTIPAWVVSATMQPGETIRRTSLEQVRVDKKSVIGTLQDPETLVGKTLRNSKNAGDYIAVDDLKVAKGRALSEAVPAGRVLYSLNNPQHSMPVSKISQGDRFDVVVRGGGQVRTVARDVQLIGIAGNQQTGGDSGATGLADMLRPKNNSEKPQVSPLALIVAVRPGDVYPLASVGETEIVSLILHSAHDLEGGQRQHIGPNLRYREVEVLAGLKRSSVRLVPR